ncbi:MAG: ATP-binding cassette domain-containing protein [Spirochaetes bacterium]|nr:ATP-binding cassette domain-containing protein [Spirochaetota bacterium]MBN2770985.1 ATP-binding cassette domain-containing protein [Spirochaetota bacterium]
MFSAFCKLLSLLSASDKRKLAILIIVILITAFISIVGIASIMPFVAIMGDTSLIMSNEYLNKLYTMFGNPPLHSFVIYLGMAVLILFLAGNLLLTLSVFVKFKVARTISYNLTKAIFTRYLYFPYEFFLARNSSELVKNVFSETETVTNDVITPMLEFIKSFMMSTAIIAILLIMSPGPAIIGIFTVGLLYSLFFAVVKNYLKKIGIERIVYNEIRFKTANEAFGGIKDVKLLHKENYFIKTFSNSARAYETRMANGKIIATMPHYILEGLAFGSILAISLILFAIHESINDVLPLIAFYTYAGYKIMPNFKEIFKSVSTVRKQISALDLIYRDLRDISDIRLISLQKQEEKKMEPISFKESICLDNIIFNYENNSARIADNLSLTIKANTTVAFFGTTGCGKTTIIDIILGLLIPKSGKLLIDGIELNEKNIYSWQRKLGYVPQNIFLVDDTISANIAFGIPHEKIDMNAVKTAAHIANMDQFIENNLPSSYETVVGERGVRLSGGQKQRIGIARAVYHNPDVLFLDEATSALDNATEAAVMDAIDNLSKNKTIILIAHRLSSIKKCDTIFFLDKGKIITSGTYNELLQNCEEFKKIAMDISPLPASV